MKRYLIALLCALSIPVIAQQVQAPSGINFGNGAVFLESVNYGAPVGYCSGAARYLQLDAVLGKNAWECIMGVWVNQASASISSGTVGSMISRTGSSTVGDAPGISTPGTGELLLSGSTSLLSITGAGQIQLSNTTTNAVTVGPQSSVPNPWTLDLTSPITTLASIQGAGWITGVGAPSQTCSDTIYTGYFYTSSILTLYQCSNATGTYQWNIVSGSIPPASATVIGTNGSSQFVSASTTGTGNVVLASSPTITGAITFTGAGTASGTLSNLSGISSTLATAQTMSGKLSVPTFADTGLSTAGVVTNTSAGLLGTVGTTGTGNVVLASSPTLVTPTLGAASSTSLTASGTVQGATVNATSGYQVNGTALAASNLSNGVTGTGSVVLASSPTLVTPTLGSASATSLTASGTVQGSTLNATTGYQVNGTALAASNLSNGVTGTGNVVLASSPTITGAMAFSGVGVASGTLTNLSGISSVLATLQTMNGNLTLPTLNANTSVNIGGGTASATLTDTSSSVPYYGQFSIHNPTSGNSVSTDGESITLYADSGTYSGLRAYIDVDSLAGGYGVMRIQNYGGGTPWGILALNPLGGGVSIGGGATITSSSKILQNCGTITQLTAGSDALSCSWVTTSSTCTVTPTNSAAASYAVSSGAVPYYVPTAGTVTVYNLGSNSDYSVACSAN